MYYIIMEKYEFSFEDYITKERDFELNDFEMFNFLYCIIKQLTLL